jgi:limonene-1,2-epoxide hydrolase
MSSPETVVREFCDLMPTKDLEKLKAMLTDDVVYHNIPMEPSVGIDATVQAISTFFDMFRSMEFRILNLASTGDVVLTERIDVLSTDSATADLPVMGAFEVREGRISAWRDYFDLAQVGKMLSGD